MSESLGPVKNWRMPSTGGASAMGFVASSTSLPFIPSPASFTASSATRPFTASTSTSPCDAVSANVAAAMPLSALNAASLLGSRLPMRTSQPFFAKPFASTCAT
jgi:hypothetical protein